MENNAVKNMNEEMLMSFEELIEADAQLREAELVAKRANKWKLISGKICEKAEKKGYAVPQEALSELESVVMASTVRGGVAVATSRKPGASTIDCESFVIEYKLEKNDENSEWNYPNVLWIWFARKGELEEKRKVQFGTWLANKKLPMAGDILEHVNVGDNAGQIDLTKEVHVHIYQRAVSFVLKVKLELDKGGAFVGQKTGEKLAFIPTKPIGFITGNEVYISAPEWKYDETDWTFRPVG